jgi:hypothetical protein
VNDIIAIGREDVNCVQVAQDRISRLAVVNTTVNFRINLKQLFS